MKKPISKYAKRILRAATSQTNWGFTWDFTGANNETETREHKPSWPSFAGSSPVTCSMSAVWLPAAAWWLSALRWLLLKEGPEEMLQSQRLPWPHRNQCEFQRSFWIAFLRSSPGNVSCAAFVSCGALCPLVRGCYWCQEVPIEALVLLGGEEGSCA